MASSPGSIDSIDHRAWYTKFYIENPNVGVCILVAIGHAHSDAITEVRHER